MWAKFGSYNMAGFTGSLGTSRYKMLPFVVNMASEMEHGSSHFIVEMSTGIVFPFGARPRRKKARCLGKNLQAAGVGKHHHRQHLQAA